MQSHTALSTRVHRAVKSINEENACIMHSGLAVNPNSLGEGRVRRTNTNVLRTLLQAMRAHSPGGSTFLSDGRRQCGVNRWRELKVKI